MSSAPTCEWKWEHEQPQEASSWKKNTSAPVEDASLNEVLETAEGLVCNLLDDEEPTILPAAFARAKFFLRTQSLEMKKRLGYFPPTPRITPGPKGSVDLHWMNQAWALLVNIPASDALATFYGDCQEGGKIKGNLDPRIWQLGIITWLSKS